MAILASSSSLLRVHAQLTSPLARLARRLILRPALVLTALAPSLSAVTIVNTGITSNIHSGFTLGPTQSLAGEFSVGGSTTLSSIEGWIFTQNLGSGSYTLALAADNGPGGNVPGTVLYSTTFSTVLTSPNAPTWQGASGLNWSIGAGSYWVIFGSAPGGASGGMWDAGLNPLATEASFNNNIWNPNANLHLGVRISGSEPVPAASNAPDGGTTAILFGMGLIGLSALRRSWIAA